MLQKTLLFIFTLFAMACGQVQDDPAPPAIDKKTLEKAEELYCKQGQSLVEDRPSLNVTFENLTEVSNIFAFSNSGGDCALEEDIDQNWPSEKEPMSFKMKLNHKCLPNHSIWEAYELPSQQKPEVPVKNEKTYVLKKMAEPNWPAIQMLGTNNLAGSYVGGLTGLRILVCQ